MKNKVVLIIVFVGFGLFLVYLLIRIQFAQFSVVFPGITVYNEQVGGASIAGGCFNNCYGNHSLLYCGKKDTQFNTFGKQCKYLCVGKFYNNCWK